MIRYAIFDFDGTIADSRNVFLDVYNYMAEKHKFKKIVAGDLESLRRLNILQRCRHLNVPVYKIPFLASELYKHYSSKINDIKIYDGIKELLEHLTLNNIRPVIISSNSEKNIREILEINNIRMDDVICSNNIFGKDKMISRFLSRKKLMNEEVIYIGDELRDIVACRKCKIKIAWVSWGYDIAETVEEACPDFIVHSTEQLREILLKH
jgi:phosphoglycolate phosphatase